MEHDFSSIQGHDAGASPMPTPSLLRPRDGNGSVSSERRIASGKYLLGVTQLHSAFVNLATALAHFLFQAGDRIASCSESRLSMSFSAMKARACGERERTSAMIVSMAVFIKVLYTASIKTSIN